MKKILCALFGLTAWFAVIVQYILMIENRTAPIAETIIRFFSFFTILTNVLVAVYFTSLFFTRNESSKPVGQPGVLTAVTIYITMVGVVYQVALRHMWHPTGMQQVVDELLHSVVPLLAIIFWCMYERFQQIEYKQIITWAIYPLVYLAYILIRGSFANFYPYPFIDVTNLGMTKALVNAAALLLFFTVIAVIFIFAGKNIIKR